MARQPKNEVQTPDKILSAARKLFVEHGFAGTSISDIASEAKVNHSLIFHHFGNKQNLWLAVKQDIVQQTNAASPLLPSLELPFATFLQKLFHQKITFYRSNPDIVRMINWQRMEYDKETEIGLNLTKEAKTWLTAFEHYQKTGNIDPSHKSEFVLSFILSLISSAALDPNVFINSAKNREAYIQFCVETLLNGLKKQ